MLSTALDLGGFLGCLCIVLILTVYRSKREIPFGLVALALTAAGLIYLPFADTVLKFSFGKILLQHNIVDARLYSML